MSNRERDKDLTKRLLRKYLPGRQLRSLIVVALFAIAAIVVPSNPAQAIVFSGFRTVDVGGDVNRTAVITWHASYESMAVTADLDNTLVTGYCLDSWFDWATPEGQSHFDGRGARTCQHAVEMQGPQLFESYNMNGMQKAGGAYGPNNNTTSHQYNDAAGADISINTINTNMATNQCSTRWWRRNSNGTTASFTGGSPTSASC